MSTDSVPLRPSRAPTASACAPYRELIVEALGRGRNAMAIWQDLVDAHGFTGRYASVRRFVSKLRGSVVEPRAIITTAPGEFSRVNFTYTNREIETISTPGTNGFDVTRFEYDAYGNRRKTTTPRGIVTESLKDALGRATLVKTPTDSLQTESLTLLHRVLYDASDRDSITKEWNASDSLAVEQRYDAEGNVIEVIQRGSPDDGSVGPVIRRFAYDNAGRKISERLVHGTAHVDEEVFHWTYDPAGNLITGGRDAVNATLSYDALNRVRTRTGTATATYTYDVSGMRTANNDAAQIGRSYYPNGLIEFDTLRIAKADGSPGGATHTYVLHYTYDLSGRRKVIDHPSQLAGAGTTAQTTHGYDQLTGLLSSITDKFGQVFQYRYDAAGRLDTLISRAGSANPVTEARSYDPDSRLARRTVATWANETLHDDVFAYDARDKVLSTSHDHFDYDIRGRTTRSVLGSVTETMRLDAFGNALESNTLRGRPGADRSTYEPGSGRLRLRMAIGETGIDDTTSYDIDLRGNTYHTRQLVAGGSYLAPNGQFYQFLTLRSNTDDTFDDRAKLVSHTLTFDTLFHRDIYNTANPTLVSGSYQSQELYRYDALGRRVWTRSIKGPTCNSSSGSPDKWTGCHNTLTRTIWDGNQILYEVRVDGSPDATAGAIEDDGPSTILGGIIGYIHGYGIDEPVALDKNGIQVLPISDWRGHFDLGICGTVRCPSTQVKFPQRNVFGAANWAGNLPAPSWYGSLIEGQVDASGYVYQRNRYLDPSTGRFTQEDPIGLAGGLNLYGFAGGDPITFSDPFGLCCFGLPGLGATMSFAKAMRAVDIRIWHDGPGAFYAKVANIGMILSAAPLAFAAPGEGPLVGANYAQRTYSETFSSGGSFAGMTVNEVADGIRSGSIGASEVSVEYIVRDGNTLMLNTRSAQALERAGVPRDRWNGVNVTGDLAAEARLTAQLRRNGLNSEGTPTTKPNP